MTLNLFELSKILSKDDIIHLIKQLNAKINNKTKISEITGKERAMIYKYLNNKVSNIKEDTKYLLLGASLTYNQEFTLNFILNRLKYSISSIAYSILDYYFDKLLKTSDFGEFYELYNKFIPILLENEYYLIQNYKEEIMQLTTNLEMNQQSFLKFLVSPTELLKNAEKERLKFSKLIDKAKNEELFIREQLSKTTSEPDESMIPSLLNSYSMASLWKINPLYYKNTDEYIQI